MRKKQLSIFLYALIIIGCGIYFYYEIHKRDNFINDLLNELKENSYNPLAELNKRIFKSANRFVVNVVYILKDCKCTYFP